MNGPERLAGPNVVQQIKHACLDDDIHLSGITQRNIVLWGLSRVVLIDALIRHIDESMHIRFADKPELQQALCSFFSETENPGRLICQRTG